MCARKYKLEMLAVMMPKSFPVQQIWFNEKVDENWKKCIEYIFLEQTRQWRQMIRYYFNINQAIRGQFHQRSTRSFYVRKLRA